MASNPIRFMASMTGLPRKRFEMGVPWNMSPAESRSVPPGFFARSSATIFAIRAMPPVAGLPSLPGRGRRLPWKSLMCRTVRSTGSAAAGPGNEEARKNSSAARSGGILFMP